MERVRTIARYAMLFVGLVFAWGVTIYTLSVQHLPWLALAFGLGAYQLVLYALNALDDVQVMQKRRGIAEAQNPRYDRYYDFHRGEDVTVLGPILDEHSLDVRVVYKDRHGRWFHIDADEFYTGRITLPGAGQPTQRFVHRMPGPRFVPIDETAVQRADVMQYDLGLRKP